MKILITGGTGFIGSRLALSHLEQGDEVRVLGQENTEAESQNKKLMEDNGAEVRLVAVTDRDAVFDATKDIDVVFHLAAAQHEANVPDQHFWDVNVEGTRNVLDASVDAGVKKFIHGSTIGVYGSALDGTLDEQSPLKPDNIYGVTKLEGEKLVRSYSDKLPLVIIRISETYGPGDRRLLKLFKAIKKGSFFMIGNGKNLHHPIYIDDLIEGFDTAANANGIAQGQTFVLSGKDIVTTDQMTQTIASSLNTSLRGLRAPMLPFLALAYGIGKPMGAMGIQPPIHPRRMDFFRKSFVFSQDFSAETLGFQPKHSFEYGVQETAKWYEETGQL